ncbi:hypothetical protein BCR32DRAFT_285198 [Anaeromyces robustus]|jgi:hypothetical protein|uniref:Cyclin N-terminal domain-containing protein n=1 Tax=Anaeromyces robustus TaxID=1754192 RepID=A0A1Y1WPE2_9FUNG|nr:hypothetical protein BCR32DRAFT_285198 [Anaeromyces robustus]|eukprot:ORX75411.1 hypothetical protein BCR32DRAFT_285198 [Anaeromyces robustus]
MPATSAYEQTYETIKYDDNKPKYSYIKKTINNSIVGAFRTQKLDSYTLVNLSKFMTYAFYNIWENNNDQSIYYDRNDLISYLQQNLNNETNPNFEHFQDFCEKILGATETSFSLCLCTLKLIERLRSRNSEACGSDGFEYRIFIAAYIIAYKFFTERSINNKAWEPVCGMDVSQINIMEIEMLFGISFNINITSEEFIDFIQDINIIFSNNFSTNVWYTQEIKPILSTIVRETSEMIMMNDESIAYHDSQDTNVEYIKSSASNPMKSYCRTDSCASTNSTLVNGAASDITFDDESLIDEDSIQYALSPVSVNSDESSSILTR